MYQSNYSKNMTVVVLLHLWLSMHKPTIHRKTSKSSFLHHPLTKPLLITTMFLFFPCDLLFSTYTTVSVIQLKMYISRNICFQFRIRMLHLLIAQEVITSFSTNTYRVLGPNFAIRCAVKDRCHLWHKRKIKEMSPLCYFGPYWKFTMCSEWSVYA